MLWRYTAWVTEFEGGGGEAKEDLLEVIVMSKPRGWVVVSQAIRGRKLI